MSKLAIAFAIALAGIGAACQRATDACQQMFDKLVPILDKDGGGKRMSDADRMKALSECRDVASRSTASTPS